MSAVVGGEAEALSLGLLIAGWKTCAAMLTNLGGFRISLLGQSACGILAPTMRRGRERCPHMNR